jgi:poly(glycerol-phosphate) alpha-glucosyltransferase
MRVALLTSELSMRRMAGVWSTVSALATALGTASVDCRVLGLADPLAQTEPPPAALPFPATAFPVRGPRALGWAPALLPALAAMDPDLVHLHGLWTYPSWAALRWSEGKRRPRLVSAHGMLEPWALRRSAWKKRLARLLFEDRNLRGATCLHAANPAELRAIRAFGLANPVAVIPNGVALPALGTAPPPPAWRRDLPEDARVLLFLGRLHPKKGLVELVEGWGRLEAAERGPWHLVLAGWDEAGLAAGLAARARASGLGDRVHLVGPQLGPEKAATLAHAEGFVLPSHSEGMPVAVLEAWAHGLPVVMTPACNLPMGFAAGAALSTEPAPEAIARSLRELLALPAERRRAMGEAGRRLAAERFAWEQVAAGFTAVYRWLLGSGTAPACVATG